MSITNENRPHVASYAQKAGLLGLGCTWTTIALAAILEPKRPAFGHFVQRHKIVSRLGVSSFALVTLSSGLKAFSNHRLNDRS